MLDTLGVFIILVTTMASACGGSPVDQIHEDDSVVIEVVEPEEEYGVPPLGNLPFGYFEQQCQWDACTPPPSKPGSVFSNPIR